LLLYIHEASEPRLAAASLLDLSVESCKRDSLFTVGQPAHAATIHTTFQSYAT